MAKKILFLSGRGGTGKSTICTAVGKALAQMGKKTLIEEIDMGFGCMDLMLNLQEETVYNLKDALLYPQFTENAVLKCEEKNLYFIKSPYDTDFEPKKEDIINLHDNLEDKFDFILMNTGGKYAKEYQPFYEAADMILLVTTPDPVCIRSSEKAANLIRNISNAETGLIINKVKVYGKNAAEDFDEIIDKTCCKLVGILPYSWNFSSGKIPKNNSLWQKSINNLCLRLNNFNIYLAII